jgi:trehalose synthase
MKVSAPIEWLRKRSMLLRHDSVANAFSGQSAQWKNAFGRSRPQDCLDRSSVWFAAYPDSLVGSPGENALDILGSPKLHQRLSEIGVEAIHTGPMKLSGSVTGTEYGPSIDGHFDRIESAVDPDYGSEDQYKEMVNAASRHGIIIVGDLVPGHTGKGPDFRLATLNEPGFPGLYTMVEIDAKDWHVLPAVPPGEDSANLSLDDTQTLKNLGYDPVGPLDLEVFARPGIKESCWSVTDVVCGVDGKDRRWVYLHIFKEGQPSLNWSDPGYAAHRLMTADMLHSLTELGAKGLRLDATMFLGIEARGQGEKGWLGGHPLSSQVTDLLGTMIRKFGGFSFQELNTDLEVIRKSLSSGPEFNYDFCTRPGYLYALVLGDGGPLRLMLRQMLSYGVQPTRLVHGLQNHDELMLETTHLSVLGEQVFEWEDNRQTGDSLFEHIHEEVVSATTGDRAPYNKVFAMSPGVCSTLPGLIAAGLGITDITQITPEQTEKIKQIHLLAAAFNALQGGVFLLSGWDLVGALPIPTASVKSLVADNDHRWINRGGYDLLGTCDDVSHSIHGLPKAQSLYGDLETQLRDPSSFASRVKSMLSLRDSLGVAESELASVPIVTHPGVVILVNKLSEAEGRQESWQITALNFGKTRVEQSVSFAGLSGDAKVLWSNLQGVIAEEIALDNDSLTLDLLSFEAKLIVVYACCVSD